MAVSQTNYQKATARAQARGFASPYAERKARAVTRGYSSPRTERKARETARGKQRDYQLERENANRRANARGFRNASEQRKFNKLTGVDRITWQKERTLQFFGISESTFNKIRRANRNWAKEYALLQYTALNTYRTEIDGATKDWSEDRVGYVIAFYNAVVNPKTNYDTLVDKKGRRIMTKEGKPLVNRAHYEYLVKYANMSVSEYEARYGSRPI